MAREAGYIWVKTDNISTKDIGIPHEYPRTMPYSKTATLGNRDGLRRALS